MLQKFCFLFWLVFLGGGGDICSQLVLQQVLDNPRSTIIVDPHQLNFEKLEVLITGLNWYFVVIE